MKYYYQKLEIRTSKIFSLVEFKYLIDQRRRQNIRKNLENTCKKGHVS